MSQRLVTVTGLPRAGSTLLCQLLGEHPDIDCEGHSSPLCNALLMMRRFISDDPFLLSQLDVQFDETYQNLLNANKGFLRGWYANSKKPVVVDKNRAWLHAIEHLLQLAPEAKMLVCIRELGQIYGSVEAQHQKTLMLDFIDHLADFDRFGRADQLFAKDKTIGAPLISISSVRDLPAAVKSRLYFVKYEDLLTRPEEVMSAVYEWLDLKPHTIDRRQIATRPGESDSHYRFKYQHKQSPLIGKLIKHEIQPRLQEHIERAFPWFYEMFYPRAQATTVPVMTTKVKCLWLTGYSGAGKSTIATLFAQTMQPTGIRVQILDGDDVRRDLSRDLGFSPADRTENLRRLACVARLLADSGVLVVVACISPMQSQRDIAKAMFAPGEFLEVFVDTPLAECERRDPKGLYAKARRHELKEFTGVDSAYERPLAPAVHLHPDNELPAVCVQHLMASISNA